MNWSTLIVIALVIMCLIILWARCGGAGAIGRRIRLSDHLALEDAILEKQEQIDAWEKELLAERNVWRRRDFLDDIADARQTKAELIALRPKYAVDKPRKSC